MPSLLDTNENIESLVQRVQDLNRIASAIIQNLIGSTPSDVAPGSSTTAPSPRPVGLLFIMNDNLGQLSYQLSDLSASLQAINEIVSSGSRASEPYAGTRMML